MMTRPENVAMRRVRRIHMLGIGGTGMAGIAEVLINLGYQVSGTDLRESAATRRLAAQGARIFIGHAADNVIGADVVVCSTAVKSGNVELERARKERIPVVRRAEMLAELMRFRHGIAIAGTHGKTSTTSLVAAILAEGGLDPTFVVGGKVKSADTNARLGQGDYLVAEADESDASFLHLNPMIAAVTNIDADHLETYGGSFDRLKETFVEFLHRLPFYGLAVMCIDDPVVREILPRLGRPLLTYGTDERADVRAVDIDIQGQGHDFTVRWRDGREVRLHLNFPGLHNVLNATAAIAIARELDVEEAAMIRALKGFQGIGRRCEGHGWITVRGKRLWWVDDYGHHPRELAATFQAMRHAHPDKRLVVAFQPHRYTRTRDLYDDFCEVLSGVDALLLLEVYPAGEPPIENADARSLARGIRARGKVEPVYVPSVAQLVDAAADVVHEGDLLLTIGAGDIGSAGDVLKAEGV